MSQLQRKRKVDKTHVNRPDTGLIVEAEGVRVHVRFAHLVRLV